MNYQNNKYEIAVANKNDGLKINQVFENESFEGKIAIQYLRNPDTLDSYRKEGERVVMMIVRDKNASNKIIGTGGCILRKAYYQGKITTTGYLTGLKIIPEYQKKVYCIPQIYQALYEETKAEVYYTTILSENTSVQTMLEKKRKHMPTYHPVGEYCTYFCKTGGNKRTQVEFRECSSEEARNFYEKSIEKVDFSMEWPDSYDLKNAQFYGLYQGRDLLAFGYVLNQQSYKQYIVRYYKGMYRYLSKLPTAWLGYPPFPKVNTVANCASAGIFVKDNEVTVAKELWQQMLKVSKKYDFLIIGLTEDDPLLGIFQNGKSIKYKSRLYLVDWEKKDHAYIPRHSKIEVAFL